MLNFGQKCEVVSSSSLSSIYSLSLCSLLSILVSASLLPIPPSFFSTVSFPSLSPLRFSLPLSLSPLCFSLLPSLPSLFPPLSKLWATSGPPSLVFSRNFSSGLWPDRRGPDPAGGPTAAPLRHVSALHEDVDNDDEAFIPPLLSETNFHQL